MLLLCNNTKGVIKYKPLRTSGFACRHIATRLFTYNQNVIDTRIMPGEILLICWGGALLYCLSVESCPARLLPGQPGSHPLPVPASMYRDVVRKCNRSSIHDCEAFLCVFLQRVKISIAVLYSLLHLRKYLIKPCCLGAFLVRQIAITRTQSQIVRVHGRFRLRQFPPVN